MKRMISKKFLILIISGFLVCVSAIILACAGGDDDYADFFNSFFAPETSNNSESAPFFRSIHEFYKSNSYDDAVHIMDSTNIMEWQQFFNGKPNLNDLNFLIYKSKIEDIDTSIFYIKNNTYPISQFLKKNTVLAFKDKTLVKDFLFYLGYAKRCEPYVTFVKYWWNNDSVDPRRDTTSMQKLISNGLTAMNRSKWPFLKERYAFQILRLYFHSDHYQECIDFYDNNKNLFISQNTIPYRAMGYYAASHFRNDDNNDVSNYLYSIIFDKCKEMRKISLSSFKPYDNAGWERTLVLTKNNHEKEVLWQMLGISYDPLRAMKEIYSLNPQSELIDLLLMRAVNINEEDFIREHHSWDSTAFSSYALNTQLVDGDLLDFSQQVADKGNSLKPYLWNLTTGYLFLAKGNLDKAEYYLSKAEAGCRNDQLVMEQIHALRLMIEIELYNKPDFKEEDHLTKGLIWMLKEKQHPSLRKDCIYQWSLSRLCEKYLNWGDSAKAQCLDRSQNKHFYDINENIDAMLALIKKPVKNEFEKYILNLNPYSEADMYKFKSIHLTYQFKFKEALEMLELHKVPDNEEFDANPFNIKINDCHSCDRKDNLNTIYTRITFLKRILELQSLAKTDPAKASQYYFLLANGLYNITYFGNTHQLYLTLPSPNSIDRDFFWRYDDPPVNNPFFDCSKAQEYYQKAIESSSDMEFKAKCCFMAAKCEQNQYYRSVKFDYNHSIKSGIYFQQLRENYSKTKYFKEIISECGYFEKFIASKN
jgi:hypothetical protein